VRAVAGLEPRRPPADAKPLHRKASFQRRAPFQFREERLFGEEPASPKSPFTKSIEE